MHLGPNLPWVWNPTGVGLWCHTDMGQVPALPLPGCVALSKWLHLSECKLNHPGCCEDLLRPQVGGTCFFQAAGFNHRAPRLFPLPPCPQRLLCPSHNLACGLCLFIPVCCPPSQFSSAIYPGPSLGCLFTCLYKAGLLTAHNGSKIALPLATSCNLACGLRSVRTEERPGVWQVHKCEGLSEVTCVQRQTSAEGHSEGKTVLRLQFRPLGPHPLQVPPGRSNTGPWPYLLLPSPNPLDPQTSADTNSRCVGHLEPCAS